MTAEQPELYPYRERDYWVLGPEIFATPTGSVICWKGENYVPQEPAGVEPEGGTVSERGLIYTIATGKTYCGMAELHKEAERLLGHPVFTHQLADEATWEAMREALEAELTEPFAEGSVEEGEGPSDESIKAAAVWLEEFATNLVESESFLDDRSAEDDARSLLVAAAVAEGR